MGNHMMRIKDRSLTDERSIVMSSFSIPEALTRLSDELCDALSLLTTVLTEPCAVCITQISECNRRSASLVADTHAQLFSAFCPPLPRSSCVMLGEKLYAAIGTVFGASLLLPPAWTPNVRLVTEMQSLCRMSELLQACVKHLPQMIKGSRVPLPDTYAFHAEQTKVRAAHALYLVHGEHTSVERTLSDGLNGIAFALADAYAALLALVAESL